MTMPTGTERTLSRYTTTPASRMAPTAVQTARKRRLAAGAPCPRLGESPRPTRSAPESALGRRGHGVGHAGGIGRTGRIGGHRPILAAGGGRRLGCGGSAAVKPARLPHVAPRPRGRSAAAASVGRVGEVLRSATGGGVAVARWPPRRCVHAGGRVGRLPAAAACFSAARCSRSLLRCCMRARCSATAAPGGLHRGPHQVLHHAALGLFGLVLPERHRTRRWRGGA